MGCNTGTFNPQFYTLDPENQTLYQEREDIEARRVSLREQRALPPWYRLPARPRRLPPQSRETLNPHRHDGPIELN
jgi:hypothetical protein